MVNIQTILVPTDFSKYSDRALQQALELAETFNSKIYLLHVVRSDADFSILETFDDETQQKIQAELNKKWEIGFKNQINKFPLGAKIEIIKKVTKGVPYNEILEVQKEIEADLIVISTHGRSGFEDFFFGSTVEKIMRRATCSVLIVKE
jgi:nucleotide-binding universal stress UspA family protein